MTCGVIRVGLANQIGTGHGGVVRIACLGSLNADIAVWVSHVPASDETLAADRVAHFLGGKGANQATAAARLGAAVAMIGVVGSDANGDAIVAGLERNGIDHQHVRRSTEPTGLAIPIITRSGEVSIIIGAGANATVSPDDAERAADTIRAADVLLLQGEVPADACARAAAIARDAGTAVQLNPAPFNEVAAAVLPHATTVLVNRQEATELSRMAVPEDLTVVTTLGRDGARCGAITVPAFDVPVVDPTGAGDAFCGAFAVATAEGMALEDSLRFASAAGALSVQVAGAEPSMPERELVDALVAAG